MPRVMPWRTCSKGPRVTTWDVQRAGPASANPVGSSAGIGTALEPANVERARSLVPRGVLLPTWLLSRWITQALSLSMAASNAASVAVGHLLAGDSIEIMTTRETDDPEGSYALDATDNWPPGSPLTGCERRWRTWNEVLDD